MIFVLRSLLNLLFFKFVYVGLDTVGNLTFLKMSKSLTHEQCEQFWKLADTNGDGVLTIQELAAAARKYRPGISDKDCCAMFCGIDKDGDNKITKREFMAEMAEKEKRSKTLMDLFKKYDKNGDGTLNKDEIRRLFADCFPPNQVDRVTAQFLQYSDTSGDGLVSFDEFKAFFG